MPTRLLYVDHVEARGRDFFKVACAHDLEGIVGKLASGRYHADGRSTNWCKIPSYPQGPSVGRHRLWRFVRAHRDVCPQYLSIQSTTSLIIWLRGIECDVS